MQTDSWGRPASTVYSFDSSQRQNTTTEDGQRVRYGRHGDICPNNILWFKDTSNEDGLLTGTLKLADFGQAALSSLSSKTKPRSNAITMTYGPPESDLADKSIRQSYDIWSLGCVLLEFVTWILGGEDFMLAFANKRLAPDIFRSNMNTDIFFETLTNPLTLVMEVMVKSSVAQVSKHHNH
jgi:serine/threonine protein kinase